MRTRTTTRLLGLAVASAVVVVLTHFLRIFTPWGQRWDDDAYLEALQLPASLQAACNVLLSTLRIPTLSALLVACVVITAYRRQILTGLVIACAFTAAVASAEVLAVVVPRPDLAADLSALVDNAGANTFPSGHATIATALSLAFVTVVAPRGRPWAAGFGLVFTLAIAGSTVIAGWHRPSDAVGGIALAAAWMSLAVWLLSRIRGVQTQGRSTQVYLVASLALGGLAVTVTVLLAAITPGGFAVAFASAEALIVLATLTTVTSFALCLSDVDFPPHSR